MKIPRVLILYTGGTFGMEILEDRHKTRLKKRKNPLSASSITLAVPSLSSDLLKRRFCNLVPELVRLAHCDVKIVLNRDSSHIGSEEWLLFAKTIRREWNHYDGIVLLHGTDTLAYTASALSMLLRPCLKPIVITGAQRPLSALRTDARTNLISAVEIAAHGPRDLVNQVTVFFGDKLFQGNRVRKKSAADYSAFESPHFPPLAIVGTTIRYSDSLRGNLKSYFSKIELADQFSKKVLTIHVTPAFPSQAMSQSLLSGLDGIVLVVFHSGTGPTYDPSFIEFLNKAKEKKIHITLATETSTQPLNGLTARVHSNSQTTVQYAAGQELLSMGCFWAGNMTLECAFVKTSLLLGQSKDPRSRDLNRFSKLWQQELANEGMT
jgi:L-asparaginase